MMSHWPILNFMTVIFTTIVQPHDYIKDKSFHFTMCSFTENNAYHAWWSLQVSESSSLTINSYCSTLSGNIATFGGVMFTVANPYIKTLIARLLKMLQDNNAWWSHLCIE